jgi:hypothetical protein
MPFGNKNPSGPDGENREVAPSVRVRVRALRIPLVRDAVVIGLWAPVTREVMTDALKVITPERFIGIDIQDDTISCILVREAVLRKISWDLIHRLVQEDIKPLMTKSEILALRLNVEVVFGENFYGKNSLTGNVPQGRL